MLQGHLEIFFPHADPMQVLGAHNMLAGSLLAILFVCTGFSGTAEGKLTASPSRHIHEYINIYQHIYICTHMYKFASPALSFCPFSPAILPFSLPTVLQHPPSLSFSLYISLSLYLSIFLTLSTISLPASLLAADNHVVGEDRRHPPVPPFRRGPCLQRPLRLLLPGVLPEYPVRKHRRLRRHGNPRHLPGTVS